MVKTMVVRFTDLLRRRKLTENPKWPRNEFGTQPEHK